MEAALKNMEDLKKLAHGQYEKLQDENQKLKSDLKSDKSATQLKKIQDDQFKKDEQVKKSQDEMRTAHSKADRALSLVMDYRTVVEALLEQDEKSRVAEPSNPFAPGAATSAAIFGAKRKSTGLAPEAKRSESERVAPINLEVEQT